MAEKLGVYVGVMVDPRARYSIIFFTRDEADLNGLALTEYPVDFFERTTIVSAVSSYARKYNLPTETRVVSVDRTAAMAGSYTVAEFDQRATQIATMEAEQRMEDNAVEEWRTQFDIEHADEYEPTMDDYLADFDGDWNIY